MAYEHADLGHTPPLKNITYKKKKSPERQKATNVGLKKTRPFRFLLLKTAVLDWFMVSFCLFRWSLTCQTPAVNARNGAKTTKFKSDVLETPVILIHGVTNQCVSKRAPREFWNWRVQGNPLCPNPSPTLCNLFCQPFANLFCQPVSKPLFPWAPGTGLETRVNGFLVNAR